MIVVTIFFLFRAKRNISMVFNREKKLSVRSYSVRFEKKLKSSSPNIKIQMKSFRKYIAVSCQNLTEDDCIKNVPFIADQTEIHVWLQKQFSFYLKTFCISGWFQLQQNFVQKHHKKFSNSKITPIEMD